ncbi:MAG: VCBS repeat-containing protein, partial [Candidatus Neomarinimicrobiota bacterium]|nr:VCBS repeat-containing protein [Candidatus Neomarinimicrobiota bacterium]
MFIKILRGATLFTDITIDTGILFSGASEGVCVFDYNNDGMDDILFTTRNGSSNHLYRNEGNMIFMDVSFESNIGVTMEARTAVAGDFDNDGDLDVFIGATVGESMLFENTGEGTFQ